MEHDLMASQNFSGRQKRGKLSIEIQKFRLKASFLNFNVSSKHVLESIRVLFSSINLLFRLD